MAIRRVDRDREARRRFVGDGMQRQERLAQAPVASFGQVPQGRVAPVAEDTPLVDDEVRDRSL